MKNYVFCTATRYNKFQHIKTDEYNSGVTRYWYMLNENELKEFYLKSGMVSNAENKKFTKDFNWFVYFLLAAYVVKGAKDLKRKMGFILNNESRKNGYRDIPRGIEI